MPALCGHFLYLCMKDNEVKYITVHTSATLPNQDIGVKEIDAMHKARGWTAVGYHYIITKSGDIQIGRRRSMQGAHVYGFNDNNIGVCYIGGLDESGKPSDTRTEAQKQALECLLSDLLKMCPNAKLMGHRDFSPDVNGDGVIDKWEWTKACPCFDVKSEYGYLQN